MFITVRINLMDIDKIISIIRNLKEDAIVSSSSGITNSLGKPGEGKIAGTVQAGDNPPVRKKNKYIYGTGFRKNWLQRRKPPQ
jgi:hypothetical protein